MSILRTVERRLEGIVEGFFASTFRSGVHPIEIAKRIAREMEAGKTIGIGEVLAPNRFVVALGEADHGRFAHAEGALLLLPVLALAGAAWLTAPRGAGIALWLGLATVSFAYVLFGRGLRVLPAGPVATLVLAEPLVATILGVLVLGEPLSASAWLGAALVAVGLALEAIVASLRG